ncbi:MAG: hypothetical protein HY335_07145 [Deinococcus sp.]|nr:hypothetical protein [Deinococcus sp.]
MLVAIALSLLPIQGQAGAQTWRGLGPYGGGVYKSTDRGRNWQSASSGLTNLRVYSLLLVPGVPNTLLAGTSQGVFRSINNGDTWTALSSGLPSNSAIYALGHDTTRDQLYAGGSDGVFVLGQP